MPKYVWVSIGMLTSAAGGAVGVWVALETILPLDDQPGEVANDLIGYGAVFAGFAGALASMLRGDPLRPGRWVLVVVSLAVGLGFAYVVSPAGVLLFLNPFNLLFLMFFWPFALIGGFCMLAAIWVSLWAAGVRDSHLLFHARQKANRKRN